MKYDDRVTTLWFNADTGITATQAVLRCTGNTKRRFSALTKNEEMVDTGKKKKNKKILIYQN